MTYIAHIFAAIGLFFASLFGGHPAAAPTAPFVPAGTVSIGTSSQPASASSTTGTPIAVSGAIGNSSRGLATGPVKSATQVSFNGQPIVGADVATFSPIDDASGKSTDYSKDKAHVYLGTTVVMGADPATFSVVGGPYKTSGGTQYYYAKDKRYVYVNNLVIANADPATFAVVSGSTTINARDKNHTYLDGRIIQ